MADPYSVDIEGCRGRQRRLLDRMADAGLEMAVLTRSESVQWLTGAYVGPFFEMAVAIDTSGDVTLVVPEHVADQPLAANRIILYQAQLLATIRDEQWRVCIDKLVESHSIRPAKAGAEFAYLSRYLMDRWEADWVDLEHDMLRLRRRKDDDEIRMLNRANEANRAMYELARTAIEPGLGEIELFNQLQAAATTTLGEPLTYFGQDFQCNSPGGPPRDNRANAGQLWILDLGVGFRGYRSDNCRTFSVGGQPDEEQMNVHAALCQVFQHVAANVRPGTSCKQLYNDVKAELDEFSAHSFPHHLGHGVGLAAHEAPRINPNWDDVFEVGDFFTVEPGLYSDELRSGIRLEQNYLVTSSGVRLMTDWPLEL